MKKIVQKSLLLLSVVGFFVSRDVGGVFVWWDDESGRCDVDVVCSWPS